jgi:hypothetical protein
MVPEIVSAILADAAAIGVTGSRSLDDGHTRREIRNLFAELRTGCPVLVGDARGVDAIVREITPRALVFRAVRRTPWDLAKRSAALVQELHRHPGAVLIALPRFACPRTLYPSDRMRECFCGLGAGTWATAALAVGCGIRVLVRMPARIIAPEHWPIQELEAQWYLAGPDMRIFG